MLPMILALLLQLPAGTGLIPARILSAVQPKPPVNAIAGTCVLADITVDLRGNVGKVTILQGLGPFNDSATAAIKQWKFSPATHGDTPAASRVGVLTIFRPASFTNQGVGGPSFGYKQPTAAGKNHPPLPVTIFAPEYPATATTEGVVIIDVPIDKDGNPMTMQTIHDIPKLTDVARTAVQSWKFMPAMEAGQPVVGLLIVAISFVRPVVVQR